MDPISIRNGRSRRFLPVAPTTAFPPFSPGRDSGPAIRAACAQFVVLCRQFNFCTRTIVAIDGSKFKAVSNRDKNFTVAKVAKRIEQVEASIARYLGALDRADREDGEVAEAKTVRLKEKIEGLRRQMQTLKEIGQQVEAAPDKQVSLTDPDARSMATSGKGTGIVGYNVQIAVDAEHHLIVAHDVTNVGGAGRPARQADARRSRRWPTEAITTATRCWPARARAFYRLSPRRKPPATPSAATSPWRTLSTTPRAIATPAPLESA